LFVVGVRWLFLRAYLSEVGIRLAVYKGSVNFDWSSAGLFLRAQLIEIGVRLAVSEG